MMTRTAQARLFIGALATLTGLTASAFADTPQQKFYEGYYLDRAEGDCEAAAELYRQAADDRAADKDLRAQAQARLAACREEVASADFARLMPETTLAYVELKRPGDQLLKLLGKLGLLAPERGSAAQEGRRVAISPALIKELLGLRGAAVAITGFDPVRQKPAGVLVFHPGNLEFVRGFIETGLPIGARRTEPVGGHATYLVEDEFLVTLTARLVIASPQRTQIESVLRRLNGEETGSLATTAQLKDNLNDRDDSLLFFCINAKPIMPLIDGMMAMGGNGNRQLALARVLLDPGSLQSLVGRAGVTDEGLFSEVTLSLDEGHHNLVYNLLRMPPINWDTLKSIPAGSAGFVIGALNESPSRHAAHPETAQDPPYISAMDLGREIFANMTSFALFVLPSEGTPPADALPVPDAALVFSVVDPSKSRALWNQVLGIASLATGAGTAIEGQTQSVGGVDVHTYRFPAGVAVHCAVSGKEVLIASSRSAMERALAAGRGGQSVLDDPAFATLLKRLDPNTTKAIVVHAGRALEIARRFAPSREAAEMEPFGEILSDTVASLVVDHSVGKFHFATRLSGIPQIGAFVDEMIASKEHEAALNDQVRHAMRSEEWDLALNLLESLMTDQPGNYRLLRKKFDILAVHKSDRAAAQAVARDLVDAINNQATLLNNFAWALLTEERYQAAYAELALEMSERSNKLTGNKNWRFVDTLALARFETGDVESAIALEKKAIQLAPENGTAELRKALARFEEASDPKQVAVGRERN